MARTARTSRTASTAKRTARAKTPAAARAKAPAHEAATISVDGTEPIRDALNADIRLRFPGSLLAAVALVVFLLILTAAVGASWLFAVPTIVLAFAAGWLAARTAEARR